MMIHLEKIHTQTSTAQTSVESEVSVCGWEVEMSDWEGRSEGRDKVRAWHLLILCHNSEIRSICQFDEHNKFH